MAETPFDAPLDELAAAFELPEYIAEDEVLSGLYHEIVLRLRREAAGLPMKTAHMLLIERIASFYVTIRYKENHQEFRGYQQKEFNTYWLSLTQEFNKVLQANDEKLREAMLIEIQTIVSDTLKLITDPADRQNVRRKLSEEFAKMEV
jgi:hypothetical protein